MVARSTIAALACGLLLASCGNSRTPPPSLSRPAPVGALRTVMVPRAGISFLAPKSWLSLRQGKPLMALVTSGVASVAVLRFPVKAALPIGGEELEVARKALVAKVRSRDPSVQLIRSKITRVDGASAVELDSIQHIGGELRRVRSTHIYAFGGEIVLEESAPVQSFHSLDHIVFSPLKRSLHVGPAKA